MKIRNPKPEIRNKSECINEETEAGISAFGFRISAVDNRGLYVTIWSHVSTPRTDRVWRALADPGRRRILDLLAERERTTGELSAAFPKLSRFAVMKHLRVLHAAGLLIIRREGRMRWNALNPVPLREVFRKWVGKYESMWSDVMLDIRDAAERSATPANQQGPERKGAKP